MYGMVNAYLEKYIIQHHGESIWREIAQTLDTYDGSFIEMKPYDDAITYKIIQTAVELTGVSLDEFLRKTGRGWISFTNEGSYGTYYSMSSSIEEFLGSLNTVHEALSAVMEGLNPPQFAVSRKDNGLYLDYSSEREGLVPFVLGLLDGLSDLYDEKIQVEDLGPIENGETVRFLIKKL